MNNKGQTLLFGLALGVMIFMAGMLFVNFIKPEVTNARAPTTGLDCTSTGISDGTRLVCLGVDIVIPYFIWIVVSFAGGVVLSRFLT